MNLTLNKNLGNAYSSKAQKIRVISENWVIVTRFDLVIEKYF